MRFFRHHFVYWASVSLILPTSLPFFYFRLFLLASLFFFSTPQTKSLWTILLMHTITNSRIPILHNLFYTHSISIVCCTSDCFLHETNHVNINDNAVAVCLVLFWNACNCLYRFPHHLQSTSLSPHFCSPSFDQIFCS